MAEDNRYRTGDYDNTILAKILRLFGGTPTSVDSTNDLLRKILNQVNAANGGGAVVGPEGPPGQPGTDGVDGTTPSNFQNSVGDADAIVLTNDGANEIFRAVGSSGFVQLSTARFHRTGPADLFAFLGADNKANGAFVEISGQDHASAGKVTAALKDTGLFTVTSAPVSSFSSVLRFSLEGATGNILSLPRWNDGGTTFTGLDVNVTDTASASGSLVQNLRVGGNSVFSVAKGGMVQYKVDTESYAAQVGLDFLNAVYRTVTLAGDIEFQTSNLAAGRQVAVRVVADGSSRNLTFPVGWTFLSAAAPATIDANKTAILSLTAFGPTDADVVAAWAVEP